jgi:nucleotide-binding universal stress UspA family protein
VTAEIVEGPPAPTLVQGARDHAADKIVVGSRWLGHFRAAFASVSHNLIAVSDPPAVVVPIVEARRRGTCPS